MAEAKALLADFQAMKGKLKKKAAVREMQYA